jgi:hypothetical protein
MSCKRCEALSLKGVCSMCSDCWVAAQRRHSQLGKPAIRDADKRIAELTAERDEARELVGRSLELGPILEQPQHWVGYRRLCEKAVQKWNGEKK